MNSVWLAILSLLLVSAPLRGGEGTPSTPQPGAAAPPSLGGSWLELDQAWLLEDQRRQELETRLDGEEVRYKDRGPYEAKVRVEISRDTASAGALQVRVPEYESRSEARGRKEFTGFDRDAFQVRVEDRLVRGLRKEGTPEERRQMGLLVAEPWYRLLFQDGAWTGFECLARGEAWPLADGLSLDRELALLLPPLNPAELREGGELHQTLVLPYPLPLTPALTVRLRYQVQSLEREAGHRVARLAFSGSHEERVVRGIEWGGIRLSDTRVTAQLGGTLKLNLDVHRLAEADLALSVDLEKVGLGEPFSSRWKLSSQWRFLRLREAR